MIFKRKLFTRDEMFECIYWKGNDMKMSFTNAIYKFIKSEYSPYVYKMYVVMILYVIYFAWINERYPQSKLLLKMKLSAHFSHTYHIHVINDARQ